MHLKHRNVRLPPSAREITRVLQIGIEDVRRQNSPIVRESIGNKSSHGVKFPAPGKAYHTFRVDHFVSSLEVTGKAAFPQGLRRSAFRDVRSKAGQACITAHDLLAFLVGCDRLDIVETVRCARLDEVDHAFRPTPAVRQDDL